MARYAISIIEDSDWDEVIQLKFRAYSKELFCQLLDGKNTEENRARCKARYERHRNEGTDIIWLKVFDVDDPEKRILGAAKYTINPSFDRYAQTEYDANGFVWLSDPEDREVATSVMQDVSDRKSRYIKGPHIREFTFRFCFVFLNILSAAFNRG